MQSLRRIVPTTVALLLLLSSSLLGQERRPVVTVMGGLGNVLGGFGAGAEYYLAGGRVSLGAGLGYWPEASLCDQGTFSGAGTLRAFFGGRRHRAVLEGSYSLLQISCFVGSGEINRHYGPGISLGYRYTASGGFTFSAALGVGEGAAEAGAEPIILFGLGYTWH